FNVETVRIRTVEVEYAHQRIIPVQRHHQFGARRRVAGDVAVEGIDVGHALGPAAARGGAAYALVERDADAGRLALERADHQFGAVEEVEADPVEPRQGVVDQSGQVGGVGDAVALAGDQRARLFGELRILFGLAPA